MEPNRLLYPGLAIGAPQPQNALAPQPTWADAYDYNARAYTDWVARERAKGVELGTIDPQTGWPTKAGYLDAVQQYSNALLMGTTTPGAAPKVSFDWSPGGGTKTAQVGKTELTYGIDRTGETGELVLVKTPPADRGQGEARRAMEAFINNADTQGTTLFLNADPMDKGVSKTGLERFYRSLGFVKNMGKRKDFRSTAEFVRPPTAGE
jgi:GNAT superfamily N-acetyltransferase